ncbi:GTPase HflX [Candidatus Microgenomates bacterium]|nr:GTPase HflX [Candidatus Microgenomates bacterium]
MAKIHRVVLIDVIDPHTHRQDAEKNLLELKSLVSTYNGIDIVSIIQHRTRPDKATFIGSGKVEELIEIVKKEQIGVVVLNAIVNPTVLFNLTQKLWTVNPQIQVWDRIDLILNIFDKHAHTSSAKLQIEIARMRHMGPRVFGLGTTYFSRQGGGIGGRGVGETNIELMKRHWRKQIKLKQDELAKLARQHELQLERRRENNLTGISIVGYTNAGKTSLFNLLTKRTKKVKDALFVTLDSVTGKVYLNESKKEVLVSDTIGFIKNLPASLVESFKSTLMDAIHADILLHVIDITDPERDEKIEIVERILMEIGARPKKIIFVFNKIDAYEGNGEEILKEIHNKYEIFTPQFISVKTDFGIPKLKREIEKGLSEYTSIEN